MTQPILNTTSNTMDRQIDGTHYKDMPIQPWEIIEKCKLDYFHGAALKYLLRWNVKDGVIDLDKIIHYVEHIKQLALAGHYGDQFMLQPKDFLTIHPQVNIDELQSKSLGEQLRILRERWNPVYPLRHMKILLPAKVTAKASSPRYKARSLKKRTKVSLSRKKALK